MKILKLRVTDELYERIAAVADQSDDSIEKLAIQTLDRQIGNHSFENRQLYGKTVGFSDFDAQSKLVYVDGIWYRFTIKDHQFVDPNVKYTVVGSEGNILSLVEMKRDDDASEKA